jgi:diaminobutyrate-2-oxoglutarate transaminase
MTTSIFERCESNVRYYSRLFPCTFVKAQGSVLTSEAGREYIDFFCGAGAVNYGHNNEYICRRIMSYLGSGGIVHALDMQTKAKAEFLERFDEIVLRPRHLDYKVQFCGPTGTNAVEAALKLARKVTGRMGVFAFMGAYHGLSLGSLAVTSIRHKRRAAGVTLPDVSFMPYPGKSMCERDTQSYIEAVLSDPFSGVDVPAAIIVETVQAEGGVNVASSEWLRWLKQVCEQYGTLLICDDIQVGCGRTGSYFSFERAGIVPDLTVLSKSISGYGAPMSTLLIKPELDVWGPGDHTGTFRGYQLAFVGATAALEFARERDLFSLATANARLIEDFLQCEIAPLHASLECRGIGMIWAIDLSDCGASGAATAIAEQCYQRGLIIECTGRGDSVLKIMPALTIEPELLRKGLLIIRDAIADYFSETSRQVSAVRTRK